jgi:predicted protein tyrosine phosphatase
MNILFICNQGRNRSRTAAKLFENRFKTKSAGLYRDRPVTRQQLFWADTIIVMEDLQRTEISKRFPDVYLQKRILVLGITDMYRYEQPELTEALQSKMCDITLKK